MKHQSGQVLVILLGSLLMGGSGIATGYFLTGKTSGEIRKDALTILQDASRRDAVKRILQEWETDVKRLDKTRNVHMDQLSELLQRHHAASDDFDPLFAQFDMLQMQAFDTALAMRFALREQLSDEQWRVMFPAHVSANAVSISALAFLSISSAVSPQARLSGPQQRGRINVRHTAPKWRYQGSRAVPRYMAGPSELRH